MQKAHVDSEGGFPGDGTLRYETLSSSRCECDAVIGLCELVYKYEREDKPTSTVQFARQLFPIIMMQCGITSTYLRVVFAGMIKLLYCAPGSTADR